MECWEKKDDTDSYVSSWLGVFRSPPPKPEDPLKQENAEVLLREMMEKPDPEKANMMYILAIMLERKKILVEKDVQVGPDGQHIIIYEHKHSGETFTVIDPQLKLTELIPVQEEVVIMLGGVPPTHKAAAKAAEEEAAEEGDEEDEEFDEDDEEEFDDEDEFDEDD